MTSVYETRQRGTGAMRQPIHEVYVDGTHYADLIPLGGLADQYGVFLIDQPKRYSNPAMVGLCPNETTLFGLAHAVEMTRAIHQGHDVNSTGARSALVRRFLSPTAMKSRKTALTVRAAQARIDTSAKREPEPEVEAEQELAPAPEPEPKPEPDPVRKKPQIAVARQDSLF